MIRREEFWLSRQDYMRETRWLMLPAGIMRASTGWHPLPCICSRHLRRRTDIPVWLASWRRSHNKAKGQAGKPVLRRTDIPACPFMFWRLLCSSAELLIAVSNAASTQIVWRHFDADAIAYQNAYAILAHLSGDCRQYDVFSVIQLDFEKCVGLLIDYCALCGNQIVSCQLVSPC